MPYVEPGKFLIAKTGRNLIEKLSLKFNMQFALTIAMLQLTGDYSMASRAKKGSSKTIKKLRASFGLTQEQFAAKIGATVSTVNRWENDKGKPSPLAMIRIKKLQQKINRTLNLTKR